MLHGRGVLKDNQSDVPVHLAMDSDRASTEAARAFFQEPYACPMRIEAVYEVVPRAERAAKRQKCAPCQIQHGMLDPCAKRSVECHAAAEPDQEAITPSLLPPPSTPTLATMIPMSAALMGIDVPYHSLLHLAVYLSPLAARTVITLLVASHPSPICQGESEDNHGLSTAAVTPSHRLLVVVNRSLPLLLTAAHRCLVNQRTSRGVSRYEPPVGARYTNVVSTDGRLLLGSGLASIYFGAASSPASRVRSGGVDLTAILDLLNRTYVEQFSIRLFVRDALEGLLVLYSDEYFCVEVLINPDPRQWRMVTWSVGIEPDRDPRRFIVTMIDYCRGRTCAEIATLLKQRREAEGDHAPALYRAVRKGLWECLRPSERYWLATHIQFRALGTINSTAHVEFPPSHTDSFAGQVVVSHERGTKMALDALEKSVGAPWAWRAGRGYPSRETPRERVRAGHAAQFRSAQAPVGCINPAPPPQDPEGVTRCEYHVGHPLYGAVDYFTGGLLVHRAHPPLSTPVASPSPSPPSSPLQITRVFHEEQEGGSGATPESICGLLTSACEYLVQQVSCVLSLTTAHINLCVIGVRGPVPDVDPYAFPSPREDPPPSLPPSPPSSPLLEDEAETAQPQPVVKLLLTRHAVGRLLAVWAGERAKGGLLDLVGGKASRIDTTWEDPTDALRREVDEELPCLPAEMILPLESAMRAHPNGLAQRELDLSQLQHQQRSQVVRYWRLPTNASDGCPSDWAHGGELDGHEWRPSSARWVPPTRLLRSEPPLHVQYTAMPPLCATGARRPHQRAVLHPHVRFRLRGGGETEPRAFVRTRSRCGPAVPQYRCNASFAIGKHGENCCLQICPLLYLYGAKLWCTWCLYDVGGKGKGRATTPHEWRKGPFRPRRARAGALTQRPRRKIPKV